MKKKLKVVRVVTIHDCVPRYLKNTLKRMPNDFETCVIGQNVSRYKKEYPNIKWLDLDIRRNINFYYDIRALIVLFIFFLHYKPDIVHSIAPKSGLLCAIAGFLSRVPVRIHTYTGQIWANKSGAFRFLLYYLDRFVNLLNTICLTDGPAQSQFLYENNISKNGRPLSFLHRGTLSGVDTSRFNFESLNERANDLRSQLGLNMSNFVFSYIARKNKVKGAIDILEAFSRVSVLFPFSRLLFIGPDESLGEITELKKKRPELFYNVINIDVVSNHELYLAISKVNCLPSYREGFSTVTIEAAALGIPTIGSNIPGLMDAIENNETGILFPPGDIEKLTEAMIFLLENPHKLLEMGVAAREMVESNFSADALYDALKKLYQSISN